MNLDAAGNAVACPMVSPLSISQIRGLKVDEPDRSYFLDRAEEELTLANKAAQESVARAHYHLAAFYLDRVYGGVAQDS
jgi:protein involved in temperature-dependent protein secretion